MTAFILTVTDSTFMPDPHTYKSYSLIIKCQLFVIYYYLYVTTLGSFVQYIKGYRMYREEIKMILKKVMADNKTQVMKKIILWNSKVLQRLIHEI